MISARYAPAACLMLALALVPTVIHSYVGVTVKDGMTTKRIPESMLGYASGRDQRDPGWGGREFLSDDWFDRIYASKGQEVRLTVVRSYDLKRLYHHPELAIAYGIPLTSHEVQRFPAGPDIPVHVLRGDTSLAMYALYYDGYFVEEPIAFQLRTAGEMLFTPRRAMTLFFLRPVRGSAIDESGASSLADLLVAAIRSFAAPPSP